MTIEEIRESQTIRCKACGEVKPAVEFSLSKYEPWEQFVMGGDPPRNLAGWACRTCEFKGEEV